MTLRFQFTQFYKSYKEWQTNNLINEIRNDKFNEIRNEFKNKFNQNNNYFFNDDIAFQVKNGILTKYLHLEGEELNKQLQTIQSIQSIQHNYNQCLKTDLCLKSNDLKSDFDFKKESYNLETFLKKNNYHYNYRDPKKNNNNNIYLEKNIPSNTNSDNNINFMSFTDKLFKSKILPFNN